jgi:hypothetical protein
MYVQSNMETRSCNYCCSGKVITIMYSENVFVVLVPSMQCACAILSSVACPAVQYFSTISRKRHDYPKQKNVEYDT